MATRKMFDDDDTGDYTGGDGGPVLFGHHKQARLGIADEEAQFVGGVAAVERQIDRAGAQAGVGRVARADGAWRGGDLGH